MLDIESIRDTITCGDCLEVMRQLPDSSIDLAVTSPPYNISSTIHKGRIWYNPKLAQKEGKGYDNSKDKMPRGEYVAWQREVISEVLRLLKDDGALYYNHKNHIKKKLMVGCHDMLEGFPVRQMIVWNRYTGINFQRTHFLPSYELIFMIAKKDYKLAEKKNYYKDIWTFVPVQHSEHPAPFPVELPYRCIESSLCMERDGAIVLDPFMGSGTTAVAALMLGKSFIGIDNSEKYCQMARDRIALAKFKKENGEDEK